MNTNDTQQKHSYHEFIENFLFLFKEIKEKDKNLLSNEIRKEDESIYNAVVGFNTVKFLTEHADWNWNEDKDKNKACEVILQECDKIKKAEQKLESEVKARLKEYVDDVAGVSIYGNHASITLEDNKKEFKISEFLNSDFYQKNGISGFSTLHSDGKSGMHGFAEKEGKKIRHYVVTDGSYEMTLKWYGEKGEEYKIKINIKADGVEFIEGNITEKDLKDELKMNKDVKIGGLFLHEIQFREKGQGREKESKQPSEIVTNSNSRGIEQEVKKPAPPLRTSSLPPKKDVFNEQGSGSQKPDGLRGNEQMPNNQQKGATTVSRPDSRDNYDFPSSDPSDSSTFTKSVSHNQDNRQEDEHDNPTFGHTASGSQKLDRNEQENSISGNQQQGKTQQQNGNIRSDLLQGIINPRKNLQHIDVNGREASIERSKENNLLKKIMNTIPHLPSPNIHEHNSDNQGASDAEWKESEQQFPVLIPKSTNGSSYSSPEASEEHGKNSKSETHKAPITNPADQVWLKDKIEGKEDNQIISTEKNINVVGLLKDNATETKINDSGYSSPTYTSYYNFQVNPEQLEKRLETIEPKDTLEKLNKGLREPSQQAAKDLFSESILEKIKEGKKYDPVRKFLETKVEKREDDNTNLTIDKNSELYKLLEKDAAPLKAGIVKEEGKDTLTEHNDSPDCNGWTKRIAEEKQKKDGGISMG